MRKHELTFTPNHVTALVCISTKQFKKCDPNC